jgi:hypothetical protein
VIHPTSHRCPDCGSVCAEEPGETVVVPGSVAMCSACAWLGIFGLDGQLFPASPEDRVRLLEMPEVVEAMASALESRTRYLADRDLLVDHGRALLAALTGVTGTEQRTAILTNWANNVQRRGFHTYTTEGT